MAIAVQDRATLDILRGLVVGDGAAAADHHGAGPDAEGRPEPRGGADPAPGPDWAAIERFLVRHGLAGLAATRCRLATRMGLPPPIPDAVRSALEPHRVRAALESRVRLEALDRARGTLRDAGVPSLVFKGAALLLDATYRDPAERAFEDVDLLVRPEDAQVAVGALIAAGFRPWTPWRAERVDWVSSFTMDDPQAPPGFDATVDLHWSTLYGALRLARPGGVDPLWEGADLERGLPGTEAHFVVLADHFLKHLRVVPHVRGLGDLCRLGPRLVDTEALLRHARRRGSARGLTTVVRALAGLWGVAFPTEVIAAVGADGPPTATERRFLAPYALLAAPASSVGRLGGLVLRWSLAGGAGAALRDIEQVALPPPGWLRARYPHTRARRARYALALARWVLGLGPSPLSPNQEIGGNAGDDGDIPTAGNGP